MLGGGGSLQHAEIVLKVTALGTLWTAVLGMSYSPQTIVQPQARRNPCCRNQSAVIQFTLLLRSRWIPSTNPGPSKGFN